MTREELNEDKQKEIFDEEIKEKTKKIIKRIIKVIVIILILSFIFFAYTSYISTVKVSVREYRVTNEKIPESFNGTKILHFTDLLYGSSFFDDNVKKLTKQINDREPDIIVFTGDLIDKNYKISKDEKEKLIKQLMKLDAPFGKYAILGDQDSETTREILNQSEFQILSNEYELIYKTDNNPILLVGLSSQDKELNIEKGFEYFKTEGYNSNIYTISLIHEPDITDDITSKYKPNLILAGHSMNGNIRIPFINKSFFYEDGAKKYNQDEYNINSTKLYISSGLGTTNSSHIRLFCRPSINLYRISNK